MYYIILSEKQYILLVWSKEIALFKLRLYIPRPLAEQKLIFFSPGLTFPWSRIYILKHEP